MFAMENIEKPRQGNERQAGRKAVDAINKIDSIHDKDQNSNGNHHPHERWYLIDAQETIEVIDVKIGHRQQTGNRYLYINNLYGFLGIYEIPPLVGAVLTVGVLVFIMNAINLIDGIDGLSASLTLIALSGLFFIFQREKIWVYCILIAGLMGVLIPFLYHNIWGKQEKNQKIFMGDSGSLTLGYILGVLLIKFCMYNPHVMPYQKGATLLSVTLLLVPTFDVFRVIIVRILHRKPIFRADKNHIHHKLMRAGMTQHQALISIIALSLIFIIINLSLFNQLLVTWIIAIDIIIYIAFQYTLDIFIRRKGGLPFTE